MKHSPFRKKKIKPFIINHGTYPFDIMVFIDNSDREVYKTMEKYMKLSDEDKEFIKCNGNGRTVIMESGQTIMRIKSDDYFHGTLAHEIFHVVELLFRRIGIKLSNDSDEAYAYQIGYITKKIYEKIRF